MSRIEVGAYFYPLTTKCPERQRRAGELGCHLVDETRLCQEAKPLFEGHKQPRVFCLGDKELTTWDDADESAMARQIEMARQYGLDFFVFDTYIGMKGNIAKREMIAPLDNAFLRLEESRRIKFSLMFVFGSPRVVLPVPPVRNFEEPNRYYDLTPATAQLIIDDCVKKYWPRDNYFMINNRPYISIFTSDLSQRDPKEKLRQIIGEMHEYALKRYGIDPYIVGVVRKISAGQDLINAGVDALTGYAFLPDFGPEVLPIQDYMNLLAARKKEWGQMRRSLGVVVIPPAVTGWDASPRGQSKYQIEEVVGCYPYTPIVIGSSSEKFEQMLKETLSFVEKTAPPSERYGIVCAWNEITEGATLLPEIIGDEVNFDYLEAFSRAIR